MGACSSKTAEPGQEAPLSRKQAAQQQQGQGQGQGQAQPQAPTPRPSPDESGHSETDQDRQVLDPADPAVLFPPVNALIQSTSMRHSPDVMDEQNALASALSISSISASSAGAGFGSHAPALVARSLPSVILTRLEAAPLPADQPQAPLHTEIINQVIVTDREGETISCSFDKSIVTYNWRIRTTTDRFSNHSKSVHRVAYSSRLRSIFSASRDTTIRQWKSPSFKEVQSFRGHTLGVTGLLFHTPAGSSAAQLVSGGRDYSLRCWDVETGAQTAMRTLSKNVVTNMRWVSPQPSAGGNAFTGPSIVGPGSSSDAGSFAPLSPPGGLAAEMGSGTDANCILQCSEDSGAGVRIWDVRSMSVVATFPTGSFAAHSGAALPSFATDAMSDPDDANYFVSVSAGHGAQSGGEGGAGGADGAAVPASGGELKLWDRRVASSNVALGGGASSSVEPLITVLAHSDTIHSLTYLPSVPAGAARSSIFVATASKDQTLKVWDLSLTGDAATSRCIQALSFRNSKYSAEFTSLALQPIPATDSFLRALSGASSAAASARPSAASVSSIRQHVLYSATSNGSLAAWLWNPLQPTLQLLSHTPPATANGR